MTPSDLAARIELRLKQLGLSLNKANDLAGWKAGYLSRVKNRQRKTVSPELLEPLAAALGVRFDWLQRGVGPAELDPDPPGAKQFPERAIVGLRVAIGRGVPAETAIEKLSEFCSTTRYDVERVPTQDWIAVAMGEAVPEPASVGVAQEAPARTVHYDTEEAWRERARSEGFDPDDPEVAEVYRTAFKDAETTIGFAAAELRRRKAARKGKALGVREVDEDEEGLPGPKGKGRKG